MKPKREPACNHQQTYFVSLQTAERTPLFRQERWLLLLLNIMQRHNHEFLLHDYLVMEDHVHLLLTPDGSVERIVQLIKGGFSFQAKRKFEWNGAIWQRGFTDHTIRDGKDVEDHVLYLDRNRNSLKETLRRQRGRSGNQSTFALAPIPQRLTPARGESEDGLAEADPLQTIAAGVSGDTTM